MRKRLLLLVGILTLGMSATACTGAKENASGSETETTESDDEEEELSEVVDIDADAVLDFEPSKYVTLGEYTNLEVDYVTPTVTDEEVSEEASYLVTDNLTYEAKDDACESGDQVTISYTGTIDGEEFDGGSDEDYSFVLGEGEFLDEFEAGIIGLKAGESNTVTFTFPEDYYEELAGQEVTFEITVSEVCSVITPEYNDELVASATDYSTVEEYEESIRESLLEDAKTTSDDQCGEDVLALAISNATFNSYPEDLLSACYSSTYATYESYAEMFGMEMDEFIESFVGGSESGVMDEATEWAKEIVFLKAVGEECGIDFDAAFDEQVEEQAEEYEYDSVDEFLNDYGKFDIYVNIMRETVMDKILESAVITEVSEEEYYGEDDEDVEIE
ncbi:MAG: trigger factor [Lachnospiraceae bacterium]|nr:trigger factor [Lachnospiraceae bacterium]